jgi:hypothetical protein
MRTYRPQNPVRNVCRTSHIGARCAGSLHSDVARCNRTHSEQISHRVMCNIGASSDVVEGLACQCRCHLRQQCMCRGAAATQIWSYYVEERQHYVMGCESRTVVIAPLSHDAVSRGVCLVVCTCRCSACTSYAPLRHATSSVCLEKMGLGIRNLIAFPFQLRFMQLAGHITQRHAPNAPTRRHECDEP